MKKLLFAFACAAALWASACSNGGSTTPPPPPQGKYSTGSLSGTYAFMTNGEVASTGTNLARVGSFTADGSGNITGGVYDANDSGTVGPPISIISGSKYTVNADGRGTLTFNIDAAGVASSINFGIVLTSTSGGLMMDETGANSQNSSQVSTGSGNFIKQNTALFQTTTVNGTYTFDFSGLDGSSVALSIVGEFASISGASGGGFEDVNDGGATIPLTNGPITTGSFTTDPANMSTSGRGTVSIANEPYAFYIVDGTRVRLIDISTVSGNMLTGDAIAQDGTVPASASNINGGFAFLIAGSGTGTAITRVGSFTTTAGAISALHEDTDVGNTDLTADGNTGSVAIDPSNPGIPGRFLVTIGSSGSNAPFTAVVYLSSATAGVMQETSVATNGTLVDTADGTILAQTGSPYSSSNVTGPFAYNWSGVTVQTTSGNGTNVAEEDVLGEVTATSLSLTGTSDQYELTAGAPATGLATSGSITIGSTSTGRNTMAIDLGGHTINFVVYFTSPQQAFFANTTTQNTRQVAGQIQAQN
jgi:hypothetical protein